MFTEDIGVFFADFGENFVHDGIGSFTAIFKDKNASIDGEYDISSYSPAITLPAINASNLAKNEVITRSESGVAYRISEFKPDGTGLVTIVLFED